MKLKSITQIDLLKESLPPYQIPISYQGKIVAYLQTITKESLTNLRHISLLSDWRDRNQFAFPNQFNVTKSGTKKWLSSQVIDNPDRILFFIREAVSKKILGHIGLSHFDFDNQSCEIENVIRGVEGLAKGIMALAVDELIHWTQQNFAINLIYLRVLSDNHHAISFYKRCGFTPFMKIPLKKLLRPPDILWIEDFNLKNPERFFIKMKYSSTYPQQTAHLIRQSVIENLVPDVSHHIGCSLSIVEILTALYFDFLQINPKKPEGPNRDIFILSKAHAGIALYATLASRGFFKEEVLNGFDTDGGLLPEHATRVVPGVEFSAGSLGHGLSAGIGFAWDARLRKKTKKIVVLMSDGELNEGSNWEALLFAGHHKLSNLIAIIDYNKLQGYGKTSDVMELEPLKFKLTSFQWNVYETDGHDISQLVKVLHETQKNNNKRPHCIIAHTVKGKGVPYFEGKFESHYESLSEDIKKEILKKL